MKKDLSYYLSLPYTYCFVPEPEGGFFVYIKELPGCMSQGETIEEAKWMIDDALVGWLECAIEDGDFIVEPTIEDSIWHSNRVIPSDVMPRFC